MIFIIYGMIFLIGGCYSRIEKICDKCSPPFLLLREGGMRAEELVGGPGEFSAPRARDRLSPALLIAYRPGSADVSVQRAPVWHLSLTA